MTLRQDSSATRPLDCDVVVVGAGPVGLLLANLLGQKGLRVVILEKRTAAIPHSAAIGITPPSLHILSHLGLDRPFLEQGVKVRDCMIHGEGGPLGCVSFRGIPDPFRWVLSLPQRDTCTLLQQNLVEFPSVTLGMGSEVVNLEQSGDRVRVEVRKADDGALHTLSASWAVACDGIRSRVRELLGMSEAVVSYPVHFVMGDFIDRTELGEEAHLFFKAEGSVESFPLPHGLRRWIVQTEKPMLQGAPAGFISDLVMRRTGFSLPSSDQTNESTFTPNRFNCARYHVGRVVLGGDAAHGMSPVGGQGMNTGFADAEFLAEILPAIIGGSQEPAPLLAAYQRFRRKAAQAAIFRAGWGMWLGTGRGRLFSHLRDFFICHVMCRWPVSPQMGQLYAMLSIPYNTLERVPHLRRHLRQN